MPFYRSIFSLGCVLAAGVATTAAFAQDGTGSKEHTNFNISSVYSELNQPKAIPGAKDFGLESPWWDQHVSQQQREELQSIPTDIHTLMYLAVKYSKQIRIAAQNPLISETAITEADSDFDWIRYFDTAFNDTSEPNSNSLIAGDGVDRFNEETFQFGGGFRRRTRTGGFLDIGQTFGFQDNNSQFFIPNDQANGRFTISYSQPLLRGRGRAYNNSLILLANIDAGVAHDEFKATLQGELLEVARSYYALYQERAYLAQQVRLYLKTKDVVDALACGLEQHREGGVAGRHGQEVGRLLTLLPQRRPLARPATGQQQRPSGTLAKARRKHGGARQLRHHQLIDVFGFDRKHVGGQGVHSLG